MIKDRKHVLLFLSLLMVAGVIAFCSVPSKALKAMGESPVVIGMAVAETGYLAGFDTPLFRGAQLAAEEINTKGGALGRPLKVVAIDMASDPQQGVLAVDKLIYQDHVVALANGFSSAATVAEAPIAARNQVPMVVASVLPTDDRWVFSTIPPGSFETGVRVDWLKRHGITSVGIIMDSTPYAGVLDRAATVQLHAAGIRVLDTESQSTSATDLRPQLSKILSYRPGAILKFGSGPTAVVAAKALAQLGANVPLLLSIDSLQIFEQASHAYGYVYFAAAPPQLYDVLPASRKSASLRDFVRLWNRFYSNLDPTYGGRGWDAIYLIAGAIKVGGTTNGVKLRDAFETMPAYNGTTGVYKFSSKSHYGIAQNPMFLAKWGPRGPEIVYAP